MSQSIGIAFVVHDRPQSLKEFLAFYEGKPDPPLTEADTFSVAFPRKPKTGEEAEYDWGKCLRLDECVVEMKSRHVKRVLRLCGGNMTEAAFELGVSVSTLYRLCQKRKQNL